MHPDQIMSIDETDVATIPYTSTEYLEQAKCLNNEELSMLRDPQKLSDLQKEWILLHDQYGHLFSAEMSKLEAICFLLIGLVQ